MINRILKIINTKYLKVFKFVFFLRYVFLIFFVSLCLFLLIPNFFNYQKKEQILRNYLLQNYNLGINKLGKIKFKSFPVPHLEIKNIDFNFYSDKEIIVVEKIKVYPKLINIYNYDNFSARKITLINNKVKINVNNLKNFFEKILNLEEKISFQDLNLIVLNKEKEILNFKELNYSNYGYNKDLIKGKVFDKKFIIKHNNKLNNLDFKLLKTGISANLKFLENNSSGLKGIFKAKILKSNIKLDFIYFDKNIKIVNSFFRNKSISFDSEGIINFDPYFDLNVKSLIKDIDTNILKNIDYYELLKNKKFLKKINIKNVIVFKSKRFSGNFIDDLILNSDLAYGRLTFSKKIFISEGKLKCDGNVNLLEENPIIKFKCNINTLDKKKLLKKFKINYKKKDEPLNIYVEGKLNLLKNKVNFSLIEINNNYKASEEDLEFFKINFEDLIKNSLLDLFDNDKISNFIKEVY